MSMIDVGTAITAEFPEAVPGEDFAFDEIIGEDYLPVGMEITIWNEDKLGPKPESMDALELMAEDWKVGAAKLAKKQEIAEAAIEEMAQEYTQGIEGRDELQFELTKGMLAIGQALGITEITENPKLLAVVYSGSKARAKQEIIENANSVQAVEAVTWD